MLNKRIRDLLALVLGVGVATLATAAADCHLDSTVCKEGLASDPHYVAGQTVPLPCKTISGYSVCLANIGQTCWGVHKSYTCLKPNSIDFCQPFEALQPQCWQTTTHCSTNDTMFGSGCMTYTETWRCSDPSLPTPTNTIRLDDSYTLISSDYDTTPCATLNSTCSIASSTCTSTTPPALPAGVTAAQVAPDGCYERTNTYACLSGQADNSECVGYSSNPKCTLQSSSCAGDMINGQCTVSNKVFRCETTPSSSTTVTDCSGQMFCAGGGCFNSGAPADTDFGRAIALMEAARQGGVYGTETSIFAGADSRCKKKLFGLANCCKKSGGGGSMSNKALMGVAAQVGNNLYQYGSAYAFDAAMAGTGMASWYMQKGIGAISNAVDFARAAPSGLAVDGFSPSFTLYGFTATTGTLTQGVTSLGSFGGLNIGFSPYALAAQIAIQVIMDMLKCDQSDQMTAMRREQNLCNEIGTYCSNELNLLVGKICLEHTTTFCCFNSHLARIINQQGRPQIGKTWGGAENPDCSGFTMDQFATIDFSRIDLSEFTAEIMANVRLPTDNSGMSATSAAAIQTKVQNYYSTGRQ